MLRYQKRPSHKKSFSSQDENPARGWRLLPKGLVQGNDLLFDLIDRTQYFNRFLPVRKNVATGNIERGIGSVIAG
jgi:hypothetical protein